MSAALIHTIPEMRRAVAEARREGRTVGLVPTMGALHEGHGELIRRARAASGFVVVSVFVNPIQFDRGDDYERYPRTLPTDLEFCSALGADAVFSPSGEEMYPTPQLAFVEVEKVSEGLCGAFRPGHFRGVATVVTKLFQIVQPDCAWFGEKDAQQLAVIRRMTADLNIPVEIAGVPIVREPDGLAMSSRNRRLSPEERAAAPALYAALREAEAAVRRGCTDPDAVRNLALAVLARNPHVRLEYLEVVDEGTFQPVREISGPVRIAAAAWLGGTRLIDNVPCAGSAR
ncbi:MAG TPA: pantoate--beta-alanine ligase [Bryobacteraceae bacterium]|nr:pantoate--beta-alanine ligase [Bryobacteraceae bacterium]